MVADKVFGGFWLDFLTVFLPTLVFSMGPATVQHCLTTVEKCTILILIENVPSYR